MPRLYVTVSALALLGGPAAIASAGPIIVGTIPPPASATTAPTPTPTPTQTPAAEPTPEATPTPAAAETPAAKPAPAPTPTPTPTPAAKPAAAASAAASAAAGAPVPPDMKKYPDADAFMAANRAFRAQVATAWARGEIDAATFRSLMATYHSNVRAGKVAGGK